MNFSNDTRMRNIEQMTAVPLDLLIIGGGITGAGIALQAAASGMRTGLLEMNDFASGTSSKSTKLIHGGLRYLKQFDVETVAEVSQEREVIYQNASHIVRPTRMMLPVYDEPGTTFHPFSSEIALKLYDELSNVKKEDQHFFIQRDQALEREPLLRNENLEKAGLYLDYTSDDARLTIEIIKKAHSLGALISNYTKVIDFLEEEGKITGVHVEDQLSGQTFEIYASVVINATGPWAFLTEQMATNNGENLLRPTKGIHLVVHNKSFPVQEPIYLDTGLNDQRMIFVIPRGDKTYIGTTDTDYDGDIHYPTVTKEDVHYLFQAIHNQFPSLTLTLEDVESSWAGLRPLIANGDEQSPSAVSRGSHLSVAENGLLTIAGGKLTDYRRMAEGAMKQIKIELKQRVGKMFSDIDTTKIKLSGGEKQSPVEIVPGLSLDEQQQIIQWYGSNAVILFEQEHRFKQMRLFDSFRLQYAIEHEMALTPLDFFMRRTDALFFDITAVERLKDDVIASMADYFQWTHMQKIQMENELTEQIAIAKLQHLK